MIDPKQFEEYVTIAKCELFGNWKRSQTLDSVQVYKNTYEVGSYQFEMRIFGYQQHCGQLVALYQNCPVWSMVFTGHVLDKPGIEPANVMQYLIEMIGSSEGTVRGPKESAHDSITYKSSQIGTLDDFEGRDWIEVDHTVAYRGTFNGGTLL
jgi:Domain of unknown function (DUF5680)